MYISQYNTIVKIKLLYFKGHYAWIKNISRFLKDLTKHSGQIFFHLHCLGHFPQERIFQRHEQLCTREDFISTSHPSRPKHYNQIHKMKIYHKGSVIYSDLESILLPIDQRHGSKHLYQSHKPCAAAALLCSTVHTFNNQFYLFTGEDAVSKLLDQLIKWETDIIEHLKQNCKMKPIRNKQQMAHVNATICWFCHKQDRQFDSTTAKGRKVANHDHVTVYYIGAAHDKWNRKRRVVFDIPIIFHNFRNYHSHLIVTALSRPEFKTRNIQVIGQNMERYIKLKWGKNLVFATYSCFALALSIRKFSLSAKQTKLNFNMWSQ